MGTGAKQDRLLNLALGVLVICALGTTGLVVRRELGTGPRMESWEEVVPDWRTYAAHGQRMGPANAAVTIVEFSDFQCPFCRVLTDRLHALRAAYPYDLAVVYRHFPLAYHAHAADAIRASECAAAQGRFEAMHDALFAKQDSIGKMSWVRYGTAAKVPELIEFERCVADSADVPALTRDTAAARRLGVTATPTMLVNDVRVRGALSMDSLDALVRRALADRR